MGQFNRECPDHPNVQYFSVAGCGQAETAQTALALFEFYHYIKAVTGEENDGLVTVSAGRWGTFWPAWQADHADEIGHDLNNLRLEPISDFDYLGKYQAIVERVSGLDIAPKTQNTA